MRYFELEDRPIIVASSDQAWVFSDGLWLAASVALARKALVDGTEYTAVEFADAFPNARPILL